MQERVFNFNPGPAVLPYEVVQEISENTVNFQRSGIGILETSHRSKEFLDILSQIEADFRELLSIGKDYSILFMTGGATTQFSAIPLNLLPKDKIANFILTGVWAEGAFEEAKKFGRVHAAASSKDKNYSYIPKKLEISPDCAYLHYTSNNTIVGSQFKTEPEAKGNILICDASSDIMHKKIDVNKYGLIYAGAQKNLGAAGVTIVIIRNDLLTTIPENLPLLMDYRTFAKNNSNFNTPPVYAIYVVSLVLKWLKQNGGLESAEKRNIEKAKIIYEAIDSNPFYLAHVEKEDRSLMNITFNLADKNLETQFFKEAEERKLIGLKGHRLVGGVRASVYNSFPLEGARELAAFMKEFAAKKG